MKGVLLALDQGTSSTRCIAFDRDLRELGRGTVPVACSYPAPGLVEQDPDRLARSAVSAISRALHEAGLGLADVAALSIANQTETFVVWERESGRPVHPAIVWQDRRSSSACAELVRAGHEPLVRERTGLELDATFPATKIRWLLDHVPGAARAAEAGELAYGDVGSWLVHSLSGGAVHVAEASNAGRSMLAALDGSGWDDELLGLFGVPASLLPPIVDSDARIAETAGNVLGGEIPIVGVLGDQQASLFGQRCFQPGQAKVTLGTGGFLLVQAGGEPPRPPAGVLGSPAWRREGATRYALEGFVPVAGAAIDWLVEIGVLDAAGSLDVVVAEADPNDPAVVFVPALQGLGTPTWQADARGTLVGVSRATSRADIVRATVDGVLHQIADGVEAIAQARPIEMIRLDGGLSRSAYVVQRLADLTGVPIERAARADSTALGAAMLGGLGIGAFDGLSELPLTPPDLRAEPTLDEPRRRLLRERFAEVIAVAGSLTLS
ncbi:MAG TPA: FGGY family carbohydrate kinase [Gaiellales bacterium]